MEIEIVGPTREQELNPVNQNKIFGYRLAVVDQSTKTRRVLLATPYRAECYSTMVRFQKLAAQENLCEGLDLEYDGLWVDCDVMRAVVLINRSEEKLSLGWMLRVVAKVRKAAAVVGLVN